MVVFPMSYDFPILKTILVADGEVAVRVPRRWDAAPEKMREGYWACYETGGADTGSLWIQVDHFERGDQAEAGAGSVTREFVEQMAAATDRDSPPIESTIEAVAGGFRWHRVYDAEEDGEPLRCWFSRYFLERGPNCAVIGFNFVLTRAQMDEPEFVELREIMDREVGGVFLDPFRVADEEEAEEVLGPLQRVNFDEQVKLVLPEAMECAANGGRDGETENQWYCRLDAGSSHAGMFVMTDDVPFPAEDHADALEILGAHIGETPARSGDLPPEEPRARRAPCGAVFYQVMDDQVGESSGDPDNRPLLNHIWTYVVPGDDRLRRLQVLLMIPVAEVDTPPFPQLVAYVNGAVRRAEFPGFE